MSTQPMSAPKKKDWREMVSEDDRKKLVELVTNTRATWGPDRMLRFPTWQKNTLMYRGQQVLGWDPESRTYFDALAFYRKEGSLEAGEDPGIERFINNITKMLGTGYIGTMARGVPPTVIRPENAEILADVTTAKAAQLAITIIERMNMVPQMVRRMCTHHYLGGVYFRYTRFAIDGQWAGFNEEPEYGPVQSQLPNRMGCTQCGTETPTQDFDPNTPECPNCNAPLGVGDFKPAEMTTELGVTGTKKLPKGMVKWSVHGPMEIECDPGVEALSETPLLVFEQEVDISALRATFPKKTDTIKEGQTSVTSANADYERLRRTESFAIKGESGSDLDNQKPTFSQVWLQPWALWRSNDPDFVGRLQAAYPDGLKLSMVGEEVLEIRSAVLVKEWTACRLLEGCGMYPPTIAEDVVTFNERFNEAMELIDDGMNRNAAGMIVYNATLFDEKKMDGKEMMAGQMNPVYPKMNGNAVPLPDLIHQFMFQMDEKLYTYPDRLINLAELISGVVPQTFGGGTQEGIETAKGQAQALSTAETKLNVYYQNMKEEAAQAAQNAIECLQRNMTEDLQTVIGQEGSEFRNGYVHLDEMKGRVRVYPDDDQGLPATPDQERAVWQNLLDEAGKNNPVAGAIMSQPVNQDQAMASVGTRGMISPVKAQRTKVLQDISTLLKNDYKLGTDAQGMPTKELPAKPDPGGTDYAVLFATVKLWRQENYDTQRDNPNGWERLLAYNDLAKQMQTQEDAQDAQRALQVKQAGSPPPPPPDPNAATVAAAKADLLESAKGSVDRLKEIEAMPPQGQNGALAPQVTAASKILDTALKAVQF